MSKLRLPWRARTLGAAVLIGSALAVVGALPASAASDGHAVYTLTNSASGNAVVAFRADSVGDLTPIGTFPTGGNGTGAGLGSQGAVVVSGDLLVAVNAGSSSISAFKIGDGGHLSLLDVEATGGAKPISVTTHGHFVYALNAASKTITGFRLSHDRLKSVSTQSLSAVAVDPVQVSFSPNGRHLVVTEKTSNTIDTFNVSNGVAGSAISTTSSGMTPFGFGFDRAGNVVVSDAAGGVAGASEVTSYRFAPSGGLIAVSEVADGQTAACWIALTRDGRHAYTANAGSGNVSAYSVGHAGELTLAAAVATTTGGHPTDEIVSARALLVVDAAGSRITAATIDSDGVLGASVTVASGLPGLVGLAAASL